MLTTIAALYAGRLPGHFYYWPQLLHSTNFDHGYDDDGEGEDDDDESFAQPT